MDKDDECLVEELVDKADMDKVLLVSILVFLFWCIVLLNCVPLALLLLLLFDMAIGSLSRLKVSSESFSFAIGFPPPALHDFLSGTMDMLPPGGLRGIELGLVTIAPLSGVGTFLIDSLGLPSI